MSGTGVPVSHFSIILWTSALDTGAFGTRKGGRPVSVTALAFDHEKVRLRVRVRVRVRARVRVRVRVRLEVKLG